MPRCPDSRVSAAAPEHNALVTSVRRWNSGQPCPGHRLQTTTRPALASRNSCRNRRPPSAAPACPECGDRRSLPGRPGWMAAPDMSSAVSPPSDPIHRLAPEHRSRPGPLQQVWRRPPRGRRSKREGPPSKRWPATRGSACHRRKPLIPEGSLSPKGACRRRRPATKGRLAHINERLNGQSSAYPRCVCKHDGRPPLLTRPGRQTWALPPNEGFSKERFAVGGLSVAVAKSRLAVRPLRAAAVAGYRAAAPGLCRESPWRATFRRQHACPLSRPSTLQPIPPE